MSESGIRRVFTKDESLLWSMHKSHSSGAPFPRQKNFRMIDVPSVSRSRTALCTVNGRPFYASFKHTIQMGFIDLLKRESASQHRHLGVTRRFILVAEPSSNVMEECLQQFGVIDWVDDPVDGLPNIVVSVWMMAREGFRA